MASKKLATVSGEGLASRYINFVRNNLYILKQSIATAIRNGDDIPRVLFDDPAVAYKMDLFIVFYEAASAVGRFNSLSLAPLTPLLRLINPEFPESELAWQELGWEGQSAFTELINCSVEEFSQGKGKSLFAFRLLNNSDIPGAVSSSEAWGALLGDVGTLVTRPKRLAAVRWETSELRNELRR